MSERKETSMFCINCKHYRPQMPQSAPAECGLTGVVDLVTGTTEYGQCADARSITDPDNTCGPDGQYFEAKEELELV